MSAETIVIDGRDYVLLPHLADWSTEPQLSIRWETKVSPGITGAEDRARMRGVPLHGVKWSVTSVNEREEERLEARVQAARRSGKAAAPWFGRGMTVTAAGTGSSTITVEDSPWIPSAGDWVILLSGGEGSEPFYEVLEVDSVSGSVITIDGTLSTLWPGGSLCYPIISGAFQSESREMLTGEVGRWSFSVENEKPGFLPASGGSSVPPVDEIYYGRIGLDASGAWISDISSFDTPQLVFWGGLETSKFSNVTQTEPAGSFIYSSVIGSTLSTLEYTSSKTTTSVEGGGWTDTLNMAQFDDVSLGRPVSLEIEMTTNVRCGPRIENLDPTTAQTVTAGMSGTVIFKYPSTASLLSLNSSISTPTALAAYDGTTDFAGASGTVIDPAISSTHSSTVTITGSDAEWGSLIGSGTNDWPVAGSGTDIKTCVPGPVNVALENNKQVGAQLHHTWSYHPREGFFIFAIADAAPWDISGFSFSIGGVAMASLADLGGPASNRGEIHGFGYEQVEDFGGNVFKLFRSKGQVPAGGGTVNVT